MKEPRVSSDLADNIGNPFAPLLYAVSTLHCLTVSLAHNGAGLGTAWGEQVARQMLADAGFRDVGVYEAPGDPMDAIFITSKPAASVRSDQLLRSSTRALGGLQLDAQVSRALHTLCNMCGPRVKPGSIRFSNWRPDARARE